MNNRQDQNYIATKEDVVAALDKEIVLWRGASCREVYSCYNQNASAFSELPPKFAAGASFNFFKGFVGNAFPASMAAVLLKRAAVPIWLTTEAVKLYNEYYKNEARNANKLLQHDYLTFKDTFVRKIQDIERHFLNSKFGRDMASQLVRIASQRRFRHSTDAVEHLRDTLKESKVINTDPKDLRERINGSLGKLLRRVKDIYTGSTYGPGRTALYLVRWKDAMCGTDAERWHATNWMVAGPGLEVEDINPDMYDSQYSSELNNLKAMFKGKADCVIPLQTINDGNFGSTTGGREAMKIIANIDKYDVVGDPASMPVMGTSRSYAWINERPNTSIHTLAGTTSGELNGETVKVIADAEEAVWNARNGL